MSFMTLHSLVDGGLEQVMTREEEVAFAIARLPPFFTTSLIRKIRKDTIYSQTTHLLGAIIQ